MKTASLLAMIIFSCATAPVNRANYSLSTKDFLLRLDGKPDLVVSSCGVEFDFTSYLGEDPEIEVRSHIETAHQIEMRGADDGVISEVKYDAQSNNYLERDVRLHFFHASRERLKNEGVRFYVSILNDSGTAKRVCVCSVKVE